MIRLSPLVFLVATAAFAQGDAKPKLSVVPFAALTGEVPGKAGSKAAGMLTTEFKNLESVVVVDAKKAQSTEPDTDALDAARKAVEEAKQLRAKKKFRLADEALKKALAGYQTAAGELTDLGEVADAWALLSAVQYNTGRDDEGLKSLSQALCVSPDRALPLAQTSALFSRVVEDTRAALKKAPTGTLVLESSPSGAPVLVDGLALGATPLVVKNVPPGFHYWRVQLPNGELVGGGADVAAGKQTKVSAASANKDPELAVLASVAQNKIDPAAVAALKAQATAAEADYLVFGGLSKEGKGLTLDAFLYVAKSGEVRRLPRASFDAELLSAGMEFYNLAGELAKQGEKVGESVKVPAAVSITLAPGGSKVAEAKYGVVPGKSAALEGIDDTTTTVTPDKGATKKRRVPLQRKP